MPYRRGVFVPGCYYHVFNRGFNKQKLFFNPDDYQRFIERLVDGLGKFQVALHAYCLMPNHYHLLLRQEGESSLSKLMYQLGMSYAKFFNIRYEKRGSVFEGRFRAILVDSDEYLLQVSKYIHRNPLEARLVKKLEEYRWSSYLSYMGELKEPFVSTEVILGYFSRSAGGEYRAFVFEDYSEIERKAYHDLLSTYE